MKKKNERFVENTRYYWKEVQNDRKGKYSRSERMRCRKMPTD